MRVPGGTATMRQNDLEFLVLAASNRSPERRHIRCPATLEHHVSGSAARADIVRISWFLVTLANSYNFSCVFSADSLLTKKGNLHVCFLDPFKATPQSFKHMKTPTRFKVTCMCMPKLAFGIVASYIRRSWPVNGNEFPGIIPSRGNKHSLIWGMNIWH